MSCEPNNHKFEIEPIQTVSRAMQDGEVHSVTIFLQHCTACGETNDICHHETQEFVNQDAP